MPEGAEWLTIFLEVGRIVAVHEAIAAGLELGIDARRGFQLKRPRPGAGDDPAGNARPAQSFDGSFASGNSLADGLAPLDCTAQVLRCAVIGLESREGEVARACDKPRKPDGLLSRRHAAAARADVDFHEDGHPDAGSPSSSFQQRNVLRAVNAKGNLRYPGQGGKPGKLARIDDLVGHQDVFHTSPSHDLRFRDFLHALANGAAAHLQVRHDGGFVRLRMRTKPGADSCHHARHCVEIEFECVEIEDQGRRFDLGLSHSGLGWRQLMHANSLGAPQPSANEISSPNM